MTSLSPHAPVAIALGANLGQREKNLHFALESLSGAKGVSGLTPSAFLETDPVGYLDQPPFLNAAAFFFYEGTVGELLDLLQRIEKAAGKATPFPNGPRTLDLDIIFFGELECDTPELQIPHPRWAERSFVVEPLQELAERISPNLFPQAWAKKISEAAENLK